MFIRILFEKLKKRNWWRKGCRRVVKKKRGRERKRKNERKKMKNEKGKKKRKNNYKLGLVWELELITLCAHIAR